MSPLDGSSFEVTVDPKGRLRLPSKLVEKLGDSLGKLLRVNRGFEGCVNLYTKEVWQQLVDHASSLNEFDPNVRRFQRQFFGDSAEMDIDDQNRVLVPKRYLQMAGIDREAIILTFGNKMELWSLERYEATLNDADNDYAAIAMSVMGTVSHQPKEA